MEKRDREHGTPEQGAGSRESQRARPAPGKVTRTSKLDGGQHGPVQRKAQAPGTAGSAPQAKSLWDFTTDPWMDAAHRGTPVPAGAPAMDGKARSKGGADEDKQAAETGGNGAVTTGAVTTDTGSQASAGGTGNAPGAAIDEAGASPEGTQLETGAAAEPIRADAGGADQGKAKDKAATPTGPAYGPAAITPSFILDKKVDPRSNTKSSTQSASDPTFVGETAVDAAGKVWRYQLKSVESKGKIRIVYFTADRYPAPTPTDDSGALTNVTSGNWKDIVKDLDANKAGIPDFWSAYRAEDVHEAYHWQVEWQGEVKKELVKAEAEIAKLSLGFDKAATVADADAILAPKAAKIFMDAMTRARTAYNALGDSPGDPPYRAQVPVVEALIKRVKDHATSKGW